MVPLSFDFILKPVGSKCNLSCSYCYYLQNRNLELETLSSWSIDFAKKVIEDLANFEITRGNSKVYITWHGGEPFLAGLDWYKEIFDYQKNNFNIRFINSFQTNGTLITKDWASFLKANNSTIGISLDGPAFIHNRQRRTKKLDPSYDLVMRGMELCNDFDVHYGVLCVITKDNIKYANEIIEFFYENRIFGLDFLPAYCLETKDENGLSPISISPDEFTIFMKTIFDWYLQKDDPNLRIRSIVSIIERLLGGKGGVCTIGGSCCGSFVTIEGDGSVAFCDDYDADIFPILGNMHDSSIEDIVNSQKFNTCRQKALSRVGQSSECSTCYVKEICGGGCPRNWKGQSNFFCGYYKRFIPYVHEKVNLILNST